MEAVQGRFRRGVGVAAVAHPLAMRAVDHVAAKAQVLEGPERGSVNIVEQLAGALEIGPAAIVGADEPAANVGQGRLRIEPLDRDPASHAVIEAVGKRPLAGGAENVGTMQEMGHALVGPFGKLKVDLFARLAAAVDLHEPGEVHAHVDTELAAGPFLDGKRPDQLLAAVGLDHFGREGQPRRKDLGRLPIRIVEVRFAPVEHIEVGVVSLAAVVHEIPNAQHRIRAGVRPPGRIGGDAQAASPGISSSACASTSGLAGRSSLL